MVAWIVAKKSGTLIELFRLRVYDRRRSQRNRKGFYRIVCGGRGLYSWRSGLRQKFSSAGHSGESHYKSLSNTIDVTCGCSVHPQGTVRSRSSSAGLIPKGFLDRSRRSRSAPTVCNGCESRRPRRGRTKFCRVGQNALAIGPTNRKSSTTMVGQRG